MEARALIELLDRHDEVIGRYRVGSEPIRIGRGLGCDIVLEDPYTAEHHASLRTTDQGWLLDLPSSLNGAWHEGMALPVGEQHALPVGAEIELGQTRLRLRHPMQAIAAELPLPPDHHHRQSKWRRYLPSPKAMLLLGLVCAWNLGGNWLDSPPGSPWSGYFDELLATLGFAALWGGLWSIINQIFRREMPFWQHLQHGMVAYLLVGAITLGMSLAAYSLSWPVLSHLSGWASTVGALTACWFCARQIWPKRQRRAAWALTVLALLFWVPPTIKLYTNQHRWLQPLYMTTLPPPSLRLANPVATSAFIRDASELESSLVRAAQQDADKPDEHDGEED